jgi:monoamine oxidase
VKGFGELFDESALAQAEFAGGMMHDWTDDAFARGAYSYITVGGEGARAALGAPLDGALFFAGEATSTDGQGGTVNGALQTGVRAANEVMRALA